MLEFKSGATFHMKLLKVNWTLWSQFYHETGLNKAQMNREINQELLRACIGLRLVHFRGRAPDWRLRSS